MADPKDIKLPPEEIARKESAKRASQISSMADTLSKIQRQANEKHKANQIVLKEQLGTARGMEKVLSSVDTTIRNIAKASANLAQLSKTVTFETARGVKKITVGGIKSIQESASQYTKAISEDINWNKQNMMIGAMGRVSPIVGYFVAKMFNTTVMQNMVYKLKEKLNLALSSVSNRFKQIAGQGWEKTKEIFSGMANKVFKKGVVRTKVVSEKERDKKEKKTLVEKAKEAKVIPHLQEGGFVSKEGVVKVHAGEVVQPVEKVVEQIVDQVNKRMDKQQGSEDVYQKHEAMARAKFFDAKTAEVRANITDKEKGDRKFGRLTKIMENLQAAFGIVKSEQILTSKENRKRRSIMGTFINRYLGEVREYDRPIQWRQWKLLLDIKQGILSQKRFIGLSIEGLQAAWQQTLHEHPVFAGVYLFAKSLTKVLASPFKLLLGSLGGGSKYRKDMPSGGNNIFESLLEATSTTYVGQMHRLDQLIEYNKHILEASRDTASSVGGITSSEEVQDRMEQAKRRSIAGYGVQGLAALPSRYAARGAKQSGIVGAAGMGGIGAIYGGLLGGPLGMLLGGAGGAAVGGLGGAIGKYTKDKFTDWRKKKAEEKKKAAEAKKPKVTLISTVQDLTEAELQMVDKLENLVSEIKRGSYRGSQITSGRADDIEQQRMQMAVGQSFSMEDLTDKGDKGLSKRIELREYINRKKQKKAETDEIRKNMVGYQKQQQELKEAQQRAQEMYLTSTFAGKKEALAKKIGAAFDPIAPIKAKLEARASRKEEKKKAKELENEARRMQIREKRDAQKASAAELVKLKRKTIEGMAPGKQRDLILSKIEKTLDKSKNIQRKLYFQENKVGKGLLERAKLTGRFMKKQWRATLTNNKISGKIARRIKGFGGSVWKFLLMAGPMIMGFIKPIFAPFTPLLKIIPMFAKSISSLGPVLASIGKLVAGGAAGLGKFIAPLLGPGLALVSAGAAGAAIGTILNKFVGPKIQGVFDKWQDKGKKESAKSFEGTKKALKTATTSTNIDKVAEAKALLDYKGSLTKAGGVFGGKRTSDYGLLTSKLKWQAIQAGQETYMDKNIGEYLKYSPTELTRRRGEWLDSGGFRGLDFGEDPTKYGAAREKAFLDYLKGKGVPEISKEELAKEVGAAKNVEANKKKAYEKWKEQNKTVTEKFKETGEKVGKAIKGKYDTAVLTSRDKYDKLREGIGKGGKATGDLYEDIKGAAADKYAKAGEYFKETTAAVAEKGAEAVESAKTQVAIGQLTIQEKIKAYQRNEDIRSLSKEIDMLSEKVKSGAISVKERMQLKAKQIKRDELVQEWMRGLPKLAEGGVVKKSGLAVVDKGEIYSGVGAAQVQGLNTIGRVAERTRDGINPSMVAGMKASDAVHNAALLNNMVKNQKETNAALKEGSDKTAAAIIYNSSAIDASVKSMSNSTGGGGGQSETTAPHPETLLIHSGRGLS